MFIIYLFSDIILILYIVLVFNPETLRECLPLPYVTSCYLKIRHHAFRLWLHNYNLLYVTSPQKQVTNVSLALNDSDTKSENLSSLILLLIIFQSCQDGSSLVEPVLS